MSRDLRFVSVIYIVLSMDEMDDEKIITCCIGRPKKGEKRERQGEREKIKMKKKNPSTSTAIVLLSFGRGTSLG